ncbi:MAG: DUF6090 family protein [Bacteroidota bacterium]
MKAFRSRSSTPRSWWGYLKYAIGEILLVVIGILIAVSINNWNEENKKSRELLNIYEAVAEDLRNDLTEINGTLALYETISPIMDKVLGDSLSLVDYEANPGIGFLIFGYPEVQIDQRGYHLLNAFNSSNRQQDTLVTNIIDFYSDRVREIEVDDQLRAEDFKSNFNYWKSTYPWWAEYIHKKNIFSGFVDYALNDPDYKRRVATSHFITYEVFLPELRLFKEGAELLLEGIEERGE